MPVIKEIEFRRAVNENNTGTNGGAMSHLAWVEMPTSSIEENISGATIKRKIFAHPKLTGDGIEVNPLFPQIYMGIGQDTPLTAGVYHYAQPVGELSTQADWETPSRAYGCFNIVGSITAPTTTVTIDIDQTDMPILLVGDKIVIYKLTKVVDNANNITWTRDYENFIYTITNITGSTITLNEPIGKSFAIGVNDSLVLSSLYEYQNVKATVDGVVVTSAAGAFNSAGIVLNAQEAMSDTYTLAFATSTTGNVIGARFGDLGAFNLASTISPSNPSLTSSKLFSIPSSAFNGTFTSGDSVVFTVHAASVAMAYTRVTLPNSAPTRDWFSPLAVGVFV